MGTEIADARLSWLLGVGQFGATYAAEHPRHGAVAAKILHDDLAARADVRARFARETIHRSDYDTTMTPPFDTARPGGLRRR